MKVALAQMNFLVGDVEGNTENILSALSQVEGKADLLVVSEMAVCGYPPRDLLEVPSFLEKVGQANERIARETSNFKTAILFGTVAREGEHLYNAAIVAERGKETSRHYKTLLPTYDVFDEHRYFQCAKSWSIARVAGKKIAVFICEDIWFEGLKIRYELDPAEILGAKDPDLFVAINSSPFYSNKTRTRMWLIEQIDRKFPGRPFLYVNQVGGNDELIFDGNSLVHYPDGTWQKMKAFEEEIRIFDLAKNPDEPYVHREDDVTLAEEIYRALILGVRDYVKKTGVNHTVVGLSGGVDSSLVTVIASEALAPASVTCLTLPSRYSSKGSVEDSRALVRNLGVQLYELPIEMIHRAFDEAFLKAKGEGLKGLADENIQARIRGAILLTWTNRYGGILLNSTNKSESAVGYGTLGGDLMGGLAVIADVPKTVVYRIAEKVVNRDREIIPKAVLTKPPSAELKAGQRDTDSLPPYDVLDPILFQYVENRETPERISQLTGTDLELVKSICERVDKNEYKRRQFAPVLKVTSKAFGIGRRMPLAAKY